MQTWADQRETLCDELALEPETATVIGQLTLQYRAEPVPGQRVHAPVPTKIKSADTLIGGGQDGISRRGS